MHEVPSPVRLATCLHEQSRNCGCDKYDKAAVKKEQEVDMPKDKQETDKGDEQDINMIEAVTSASSAASSSGNWCGC